MNDQVITEIPLEQLHESPFNTRKHFDEASLASLAANIKSEGIIEPLLVRPVWKNPLRVDIDAPDWHEVVCGHRRLRAAKIAGLATVPAMVKTLTDEEAKRAQLAENLQRENVHALEEAAAFDALRNDHGLTVAQLVERTGKSEAYVYGRLKLLNLAEPVRKAFAAGEIDGEIALVFARMPSDKLQLDALDKIKNGNAQYKERNALKDGGRPDASGYREIRDFLAERYMLDLKGALWKLDDAELVPTAGACNACPKRSGCSPDLFADVVAGQTKAKRDGDLYGRASGENICTDPDCFATKKKAQLKREQQALEAKGETVIAGGKARQIVSADGDIKNGYVELSKVKDLLKKAGAKSADVTIATVQDPRGGKTTKVVKVEDLKGAGIKVTEPKKKSTGSTYDYEADRQKRIEEEKANEAKAKVETAFNLALLDKVRAAAAGRERDLGDLQLFAHALWDLVEYEDEGRVAKLQGDKSPAALKARIDKMDAAQLTGLMLDCVLFNKIVLETWSFARGERPTALLETAKRYGIDVDAVRAEATGEPAKAAKAPAAKKKGKAQATADQAPLLEEAEG
jgi:ParB/RepB/Spo0J family partition protein